jgi:FemAB-related protein (PEP-CTERM system-associated)
MTEPTIGEVGRRAPGAGTGTADHPEGQPHRSLRVVPWSDGASWDRFVTGAQDAMLSHLWGWKQVMEQAYGHRTSYLAAVEGDQVRGILPLVWVKSRTFGRHLVSMPFLDYGGLCAGRRPEIERVLLDHAVGLAEESRAVLQLRHVEDRAEGLPRSLDKVTMHLQLGTDEELLWKSLRTNKRRDVRKGGKLGLEAVIQGEEALADFYRVWSTNMRDLGSPAHSKRFFAEIMRSFPEQARFIIVRLGERPIGAGLILLDRETISVPWSSSLREFLSHRPNMTLYWEAMRYGIEHGYQTFDFGRSSPGSGTFQFKHEWGAQQVQLHWHYHPEASGPPDDSVTRHSWAVRVWKRLPVGVANAIGPRLRRVIPN